ncbi:hypothetical protein BpHYR1_004560 [Brachionus plicatilis]|uniref:Uncharacterized protein n=1 Tax=Brachionus plicatilis TaxID=10195 RepID=A0A3M7PAX0_BRAPC|nr:hypothetical protein BpHYR1_004560 [Brachionus plicatilis]
MLDSDLFEEDYEFVYPKRTAPIPYSQSPSLKKYSLSLYSPINQSPNFDNDPISKSLMLGIPRFECPLPDPKPDMHEYPKPILKKCDQTYDENLYKNGSFFNFEGVEADRDESDSECENVFSVALREMKEKNKQWSSPLPNESVLPRFNYVSRVIDDLNSTYCNTSINTKALAAKYLNDPSAQSILLPRLDTGNLFQLYNPTKETNRKIIMRKSVSSCSGQDSGNFEEDSEDDDIWLFGKPAMDFDQSMERTKFLVDGSNSDEDDDDYVLDIDKLKQLPKLL